MKNIVLTARNFSLLLCLCGCLAAQAELQSCGRNLRYEVVNDTLYLTSPKADSVAIMEVDNGFSYWADDSLNIKAVVMPANLTYISLNAFFSHKELTDVTIPASVSEIAGNAFKNCSKLKKVECLPVTAPILGSEAFTNCYQDLEFCVPNRQAYSDWGTYGIVKLCEDEPTDITNANAKAGAIKIIENNELLIIRNNEKYTLTGQKL